MLIFKKIKQTYRARGGEAKRGSIDTLFKKLNKIPQIQKQQQRTREEEACNIMLKGVVKCTVA